MQDNIQKLSNATAEKGTRVLVRIDCNVPLNSDGTIADTFRLEAVTETIKYLSGKGAKIIVAGAIGRPKGKRDESLTTKCVAEYFQDNVLEKCSYVNEAFGEQVNDAIDQCNPGEGIVLENLRFYEGEEQNDEAFAKELAGLADIYVNDAFGQCHRKQASIVAITKFLPSYMGLCLEKEVSALESVLNNGQDPVVAIIGGAKVSDKIGVIDALINRCDYILIGGAMAFTFLKAGRMAIGNSLCEDDYIDKVGPWMKTGKIFLPNDFVVAENIDSTEAEISKTIPSGYAGFDIGSDSIEKFIQIINSAKTILWNGPMGVFEKPQFAQGTNQIANAVADSNAYSVVGGGDSVAAIRQMGLENKIDHVSTGGGATLEYIEQGTLVGVEALKVR
ncbi:MAG: phosphoglycerate kinase [Acidimicrobiia bacterium]